MKKGHVHIPTKIVMLPISVSMEPAPALMSPAPTEMVGKSGTETVGVGMEVLSSWRFTRCKNPLVWVAVTGGEIVEVAVPEEDEIDVAADW